MRRTRKLFMLLLICTLLVVNLAVLFTPVSARPPDYIIKYWIYGTWINNGGEWICFGCYTSGNCLCPGW